MSAKVKKLFKDLQKATCPEDVFGELEVPQNESLDVAYRDWAKKVHPDLCSDKNLAHEAFTLLGKFLEQAEQKVKDGTYGNKNVLSEEVVISSKTSTYNITTLFESGDISDIFDTKQGVLVKISRSPSSNDLLRNEASILNWIRNESPSKDLKVLRHIPVLRDSFVLEDSNKVKLQVNVLDKHEGYYSLQKVLDNYPNGIDPRDAAWMFNRTLSGLLCAHQAGVVHGALNPSHIIIKSGDITDTEVHNGVIVGWSHSVKVGDKIRAICPDYKDYCAPEILTGLVANFGYDLYSAATCMVALLGGDPSTKQVPNSVPRAIRGLLKACFLGYKHRSQDVWELYQDFQKILTALYGDRKFRKLEIK